MVGKADLISLAECKQTEKGNEPDADHTLKSNTDGDSTAAGDIAPSRRKVQGGAQSRAATPPPTGTPKANASKAAADTKANMRDVFVALVFLLVCVSCAYLGYQKLVATVDANRDGKVDVGTLVDKDADGKPDLPHVMDTSATCHANGGTIAKVILAPVYYSGLVLYHMLYPVICLKESIREVLGMIWHVIVYVPSILFSFIGAIFKWIGTQLFWLAVFLCLDRVVAGLVVLVPLALMLSAWEKIGKPLLAFLATFAFLCKFIIYQWGMEVFTWIVMHFAVCPFQFIAGGAAEVGHSLSYWSAVFTLSKISGV
jgi:hypothetical protein